jgi:hypothetical protein
LPEGVIPKPVPVAGTIRTTQHRDIAVDVRIRPLLRGTTGALVGNGDTTGQADAALHKHVGTIQHGGAGVSILLNRGGARVIDRALHNPTRGIADLCLCKDFV